MRCKHYHTVSLIIIESISHNLVTQKENTLCKCLHIEIFDPKVGPDYQKLCFRGIATSSANTSTHFFLYYYVVSILGSQLNNKNICASVCSLINWNLKTKIFHISQNWPPGPFFQKAVT